ncbi:hypothetical protein BP5796_01694 [Coleophoma crateriformis]|uniref:Uncharacterized protein n=1 Tax=Coleophoma crateriformis TaxID=565419 RepID=A0A3D8T199_9HELO|nr:hypothetical protein BP5796_01694 [Coleophoma crateriformis]
MPVTIKPGSHSAREWDKRQGLVGSATALLSETCCKEYDKHFQKMIQSSFSSLETEGKRLAPSSNGFVLAAISSYNNHHNLVLRPEDIWFSILSQLNFYINQNAEELRHLFVAHEGQKELEVIDWGSVDAYNFGKHAETMTHMIAKNIKEPELREWIIPAFSTTTKTDVVVASILMMGAMQKYFSYKFTILCGIPSVNAKTGQASFAGRTGGFDQPDSAETKDFWQTIVHYSGGGSGPTYLSGWITAFCFWDADGKTLYKSPPDTEFHDLMGQGTEVLSLDGVKYHRIDTTDIPQGYVSVPVKVVDRGNEYNTHMIAGSVAIDLTSSGDTVEACNGKTGVVGLDTLQPVSGWWIFKIKEPIEGEDEDEDY